MNYDKIFTEGRKVWWIDDLSISQGVILKNSSLDEDLVLVVTDGVTKSYSKKDLSTSPFTLEVKGFEQKEELPEIKQKTPVWVKSWECWFQVPFHSFNNGSVNSGMYTKEGCFVSNDFYKEWSLTDPFETNPQEIKDISANNESIQEDEPKIGDLGYFWDKKEHVSIGVWNGMINNEHINAIYLNKRPFNLYTCKNFSKTKPSFLPSND